MKNIANYVKTKGKYKTNWYKPKGERRQWFEILLTMANIDSELFRWSGNVSTIGRIIHIIY